MQRGGRLGEAVSCRAASGREERVGWAREWDTGNGRLGQLGRAQEMIVWQGHASVWQIVCLGMQSRLEYLLARLGSIMANEEGKIRGESSCKATWLSRAASWHAVGWIGA